jgi:hypothetical protein
MTTVGGESALFSFNEADSFSALAAAGFTVGFVAAQRFHTEALFGVPGRCAFR